MSTVYDQMVTVTTLKLQFYSPITLQSVNQDPPLIRMFFINNHGMLTGCCDIKSHKLYHEKHTC